MLNFMMWCAIWEFAPVRAGVLPNCCENSVALHMACFSYTLFVFAALEMKLVAVKRLLLFTPLYLFLLVLRIVRVSQSVSPAFHNILKKSEE